MKSFKQHNITETTPLLVTLINKHNDPFSFLAAAMDAMASGKLKLKTRGLANARELIHAWNAVKKKKIKLKEAVDYITEKAIVCGDCFKWANDWNIEHHKGGTHKVVHGLVTNAVGKTFPHAWIEDKGKVYDTNVGNKGMPLKKFYKTLNARDTVKYTPTQATRNQFGGFGHHGPWDKKFNKWPST